MLNNHFRIDYENQLINQIKIYCSLIAKIIASNFKVLATTIFLDIMFLQKSI